MSSSGIPVNVNDLLYSRGVESSRIEFKASWDEKTTGFQVLKTICAFANDLQNLNGGYVVIGVDEKSGVAVLPPKGLRPEEIDGIQKWIRGSCKRLEDTYYPIISPEIVDGRHILVIWAEGSDNRPHKAPDGEKGEKKFWVRLGSETIDAERNGVLNQLLEVSSKMPFDSRKSLSAGIEDIRETLVREFLTDIGSGLVNEPNQKELYRKFRIAVPVNGHDAPLNVGLLFFSDFPEQWFPGARIEIVQFAGGAAGNLQEEKIFRGPLHRQLKDCLCYLESFSVQHLEKQDSSFRVKGWVSYPIYALREALVNAVYHRSYDVSCPDPIKIYLYPDRIEIISYPGPVPGIKAEDLKPDGAVPPVPMRNRRIGDFLKELKLAEGRGTGLPKIFSSMAQNGSPEPVFDFDEDRTYFRVKLPAHPEYLAVATMRDAAHLRALGREQDAFARIDDAWHLAPFSVTLAAELIRLYGEQGNLARAEEVFAESKDKIPDITRSHLLNMLVNAYLETGDKQDKQKAQDLLKDYPALCSANDACNAAILARRLGDQKKAHYFFERAGDAVLGDARALHEFAQTKMAIARQQWQDAKRSGRRLSGLTKETNAKLLNDARQLLERVIQMAAPPRRYAEANCDLGQILEWLKAPKSESQAAYQRAHERCPDIPRFKEKLDRHG